MSNLWESSSSISETDHVNSILPFSTDASGAGVKSSAGKGA